MNYAKPSLNICSEKSIDMVRITIQLPYNPPSIAQFDWVDDKNDQLKFKSKIRWNAEYVAVSIVVPIPQHLKSEEKGKGDLYVPVRNKMISANYLEKYHFFDDFPKILLNGKGGWRTTFSGNWVTNFTNPVMDKKEASITLDFASESPFEPYTIWFGQNKYSSVKGKITFFGPPDYIKELHNLLVKSMSTNIHKPEGKPRPRCEFCGSALYNALIDKEREGPDAKEHWELGCPYCAQALDDFYMKIRNEILTIDKQKLPEFEKKLDVAKEYASKLGESIMILRFEAYRAEAWLKNDQGQKALSLFQSLLSVTQEGLKKHPTDSYLQKMENRLYYYLAYTYFVLNDKEQVLKFIDLNLKREEQLYFQKNSIEWGEFYKALALTLKAEIALREGVLTDAAKFAEEALQLKLKNVKKTPEFSLSKAVGLLEKIYSKANQPAKITEMQKMLGSVKNLSAAAKRGNAEIFDVMK